MADVVAIQDGLGTGYLQGVQSDGAGRSMYPGLTTVFTHVTATTTSQELVAELPGRRQIQIQNLDDTNAIHIHLGSGSAGYTHLRIDPGVTWAYPSGVSYTGEFQVIAAGGSAYVAVVEYYNP